jgi:hypothetical protein
MFFHITYNLIVNLSCPIILIFGGFSSKLSLFTSVRKEVFARRKAYQVYEEEWVWSHEASLGEFEQARP